MAAFETLSKWTLIVALFLAGTTAGCQIDPRAVTSAEPDSREAGVDASLDTAMKDGSHDGGASTDAPDGSEAGVVIPKVTVSIQRNGNGTITGDGINCTTASCDVTVDVGASLVLQANPGADSVFKEWSGCTNSNGASCSLVAIMSSTQVTATFALENANLVVIKDGNGTGAVMATWPGGGSLNCGVGCSAVVPKGTVVTLEATPDTGSTVGWGPPCMGSGPCMVTIGDTETDVRATFTLSKVTLTVTHTGNGTISGTGGISCADASCAVPVDYGSTVTLTATPGADSDFASWTGCSSATGATCVVSKLTAAASVNAAFTRKKIQVTLTRTGNGKITSADGAVNCTMASCVISVDSGASLSLTATADADSDFKSWSGCTTATGATCALTAITSATTVNATFAIKNATFVISKQGNGTGTVTATAQTGSTATLSGPGCSTNPCTVTVAAGGTTITATLTLNQYLLSVTLAGPTGTGSVLSTTTGIGINCGSTCSALVNHGTVVSLAATASSTGTFASWSGCTPTNSSPCSLTVTSAATVTANFKRRQGATCSAASECSTGFCVGNVCCATACTGLCNANCGTGTCVPKLAKTYCDTKIGPSGPNQKSDTTLYCDGSGSCVAPTIDCVGITTCNLNTNACCIGTGSQFGCFTPSACLTPSSGDFFQGYACARAADCPTNYQCCNQTTPNGSGHWRTCIPTGTCTEEILP
jgi:hypothetical protein